MLMARKHETTGSKYKDPSINKTDHRKFASERIGKRRLLWKVTKRKKGLVTRSNVHLFIYGTYMNTAAIIHDFTGYHTRKLQLIMRKYEHMTSVP